MSFESLVGEAYEKYIVLNKKSVSDGQGGFFWEYTDGAIIDAAIVDKTSSLSKIAEVLTEQKQFSLVTPRNVVLEANTILKRVSDGKIYKVLYDNENKTPKSANLKLRQTNAIEWSLPND